MRTTSLRHPLTGSASALTGSASARTGSASARIGSTSARIGSTLALIGSSLVFAGCAVDAPSALPTPVSPPPALVVSPSVAPGDTLTATLTATPGATFVLVIANGGEATNGGTCRPALQGNCLDIRPGTLGYVVLDQGVVPPNGVVQFSTTVPPTARPGAFQVQAVLLAPAVEESNVASVEVTADCADAYEPNNDAATAWPITADITGADTCADGDWYVFQVPPESAAAFTATFRHADGDLELELYNDAGIRIDGSYTLNDTEEVLWFNAGLSPATVRLFVYAATDPQGDGTPYDVAIQTISPAQCTDDAAEPDNDDATAAPLTVGASPVHQSCTGDDDWFWIDVLPSQELTVVTEEIDDEGDVDVFIVDATGTILAGPDDTVAHTFTAAARVWVVATMTQDDITGGGNSYTLDTSLTNVQICADDAAEPNDSFGSAWSFGGGVFAGLQQCSGDDDWFLIPATAGQVIRVSATFRISDGDIDANLLDNRGRVVAQSVAGGNNEVFSFTAPSTETYRLQLYLYADYGPPIQDGAAYDLEITVQ